MKKTKTIFLVLALCAMNQMSNAQWVKKSSGFATPQRGINEMIAVNSKVAWAAAYDAVNPISAPITDFTITTDGGKHWTAGSMSEFPDYYLIGIAPLSATLCYACISNLDGIAKVVKTTDGGATWTAQLNYDFGAGEFAFFADIYFFNANEGLVYGDQTNGYFTIFTTSDGGNNWTRVPQANMPAAIAPDEASYALSAEGIGNTFWTVSTSGRVWKTLDKGLHWNAYQTSETLIDFSNLKMRDALHGLWGVHDELYRTNDGGITWNEITPTGNWFTDDLAYVPGTAATFVSTGGNNFSGYGALHGTGSSYSLDDGDTWITLDTGVEHLSLAMVNSYTGFTGGLNTDSVKGGIYKYNGSALGYSCGDDLTQMCFNGESLCIPHNHIKWALKHGGSLGECSGERLTEAEENATMNSYPNPFSESTTISFSLPKSEKVSLKIYDVTGRLITTLADETMSAGNHELRWNANDENLGIYFLKMQTTGENETIRLSVVR